MEGERKIASQQGGGSNVQTQSRSRIRVVAPGASSCQFPI